VVFSRVESSSPAEWLDRILAARPDVVVLQPHMPTLQALAARTRDIPIVFYN
jgi:DNA-binding NarL/FixJ family response regulator